MLLVKLWKKAEFIKEHHCLGYHDCKWYRNALRKLQKVPKCGNSSIKVSTSCGGGRECEVIQVEDANSADKRKLTCPR